MLFTQKHITRRVSQSSPSTHLVLKEKKKSAGIMKVVCIAKIDALLLYYVLYGLWRK